jgi:hypothetical protein
MGFGRPFADRTALALCIFPDGHCGPRQPGSKSAEAQWLPAQLANIFRESELRVFPGLASCGTGVALRLLGVAKKGVNMAGAC